MFSLKVKVMGSNPGYLLKSFLLYQIYKRNKEIAYLTQIGKGPSIKAVGNLMGEIC